MSVLIKILAFRLSFLKQLYSTVDELKRFMQNTLLFVQSPAQSVDIDKELETSLESLQQLGHVIITNTAQSRSIEVTHLGQATFKGAFLNGKYLRTFQSTEIYLKLQLISAGLIQLRKWYGGGGEGGLISGGFITGLKMRVKTSYKAVLIKIPFKLSHFFKVQNVVKN